MEAYAIISIQTASPALGFQCLVFLTDELKTQLLHTLAPAEAVKHRSTPFRRPDIEFHKALKQRIQQESAASKQGL